MKELLEAFSIDQVLLFIVLLAAAFKGVVTFWDWLYDWIRSKFDKNYINKKNNEDLHQNIMEITEMTQKQQDQIDNLTKSLQCLIESDKDDIKSWIVEKHHHYCYEVGSVDYYILESIERRYDHYKKEGGNSYIDTLMEELRALPKTNVREENQHN